MLRSLPQHFVPSYAEGGSYWYDAGINRRAVIAMGGGVLAALVGLVHPSLQFLFNGSWFSAAFVAFILYAILMRPTPRFAIPEKS